MPLDEFVRDVDIREMRALRRARLVHHAIIIRVVHARADLGFVQTEERVASDVPCLYQPSAEALRSQTSAQDVAVASSVVEFDHDTPIEVNHRLYITGRSNGVDFAVRVAVVSTNAPRAFGVAIKTTCTNAIEFAGEGPPPA